jgi:hypothetical protein
MIGNRAVPASVRSDQPLETELKLVVPAFRTSSAIRLLDSICDPDPAFPEGIVSSVYFDSRDWAYLGQKRNSDYLKTKVRLRWYEKSGSPLKNDNSFAEIKSRTGSTRVKVRIPGEYSGAELASMDLEDRALLRVPGSLISAGATIRHSLYPAYIVRYYRRRYIDRSTQSRISIDYAITAPKVNKYMLANAHPCVLEYTVLEVKGSNHSFPVGLQNTLKLGFRREAFSKYYECFRHLTRTLF